jgi:MGT family glycosyltransferase
MKAIVFNIPTSGHVDPSLPLTAELVSRGHEVIYYLTDAYRERVEATGAAYRETPGMPVGFFDGPISKFNPVHLTTILLEKAYELVGPLAEMVREERPDFVIYDAMCPWGRMAADLAGVTAVSSMSLIQLAPSYLVKGGQLGVFLKLLPRVLQWSGRYRTAVRRLKERYDVELPGLERTINWPGDLTISYTTAEIHAGSEKLGDSYLFIGPSIGDGLPAVDFDFGVLDGRPLIYASLGTVFNRNIIFFRNVMASFGGSDYQVVMSLGKGLSRSALGDIPANIIVRDYVPQLEILERSALYITHGGVGSVHQALYCGVPLVLAPQQVEHGMVSARLVELGVGEMLRKMTAGEMRQAAERVLANGSYRKQAARLGTGLKEAGGVKAAVDRIERNLER